MALGAVTLMVAVSACNVSRETLAVTREDHYTHHSDTTVIWQRDSIIVRQLSDTIYIEKWHYVQQNRVVVKIDTLTVRDTLKSVEVREKIVSSPQLLTAKKKIMWFFIGLILGALVAEAGRYLIKRFL